MSPDLDIFALPVHPAADEFPMLPDEELQELADSIKANGLRRPLLVGRYDDEYVLVDGRNRREACRRAGVEPTVTYLNGEDPVPLILDLNAHRRHLSQGQKAMAVARICPETGQNIRDAARAVGVSKSRVGQASIVNQFAPEMVDGVKANTVKLDFAYAEAQRRKKAKPDLSRGVQAGCRPGLPGAAGDILRKSLGCHPATAGMPRRGSGRSSAPGRRLS